MPPAGAYYRLVTSSHAMQRRLHYDSRAGLFPIPAGLKDMLQECRVWGVFCELAWDATAALYAARDEVVARWRELLEANGLAADRGMYEEYAAEMVKRLFISQARWVARALSLIFPLPLPSLSVHLACASAYMYVAFLHR